MARNLPESRDKRSSTFIYFLLGDTSSAAISAALVAPIITAADRAVVESVSTSRPVLRTLGKHLMCSLRQPRRYFISKPLFIVWTLYAATYSTANATDSVAKAFLPTPDTAIVGTLVSISTLIVNTPLGIWKDLRFAQFFGAGPDRVIRRIPTVPTQASIVRSASRITTISPRGRPAAVCSAFLIRDALTVFGSFALAPQVSAAIPDSLASGSNVKASIAQLTVPAMTQLIATPAHLLGLDLYNRPSSLGLSNRLTQIRRNLLSTTAMRCFRIIPAFGFGLIVNSQMRLFFHKELLPQKEPSL